MHNRSHAYATVKLMQRLNFEKKLKTKSLVAWSISEGSMDQKQIINFVQPNYSSSIVAKKLFNFINVTKTI